ncbi:MAG: hypothetical protein ACOX4A_09335 [Saccharofermentanales bacterium]|jgi:hypothetical protein
MILTLFIVFISSLILVWMGVLGHYVGFALMASSLGAMVWNRIRTFQHKRSIKNDTRERKAKWGGELTVVSGLSSMTGMSCRLFITRYDELIVEDPISKRVIPLDEIEKMVLLYGKTLESMNDVQIGEAAGFQSVPRFYHVRAWIARNPHSRKELFLAIRFQKPLTVAEYSEMTVFSDIRRMGNLDAFRLRPEVAVRTAIIPRKKMTKRVRRRLANSAHSASTLLRSHDGAHRERLVEPNLQIPSSDIKQSMPTKDPYTKIPNFLINREPLASNREQTTEPYFFSGENLTSGSLQSAVSATGNKRRSGAEGIEMAIRARRESKQEELTAVDQSDTNSDADEINTVEKKELTNE